MEELITVEDGDGARGSGRWDGEGGVGMHRSRMFGVESLVRKCADARGKERVGKEEAKVGERSWSALRRTLSDKADRVKLYKTEPRHCLVLIPHLVCLLPHFVSCSAP